MINTSVASITVLKFLRYISYLTRKKQMNVPFHNILVYWSYWYVGHTPLLRWKKKSIKSASYTLDFMVTAATSVNTTGYGTIK